MSPLTLPGNSPAFVLFVSQQAEKNFLAREEKAAAAGTRKDDDEAQSTGVAAAADQVPGIVSRPFSGQSVLPDFSGRRLQVRERGH